LIWKKLSKDQIKRRNTMDTMRAFAMGEANRGKELKVFDWEKAARLIRERSPESVWAGLSGDWKWTGGKIYGDGRPVPKENTYTYLASTWATPEIDIDGEVMGCFKMQSETPGWDSSTYWPKEALEIINEE
jgi:hypothetical protein